MCHGYFVIYYTVNYTPVIEIEIEIRLFVSNTVYTDIPIYIKYDI
jgi:hypothetical protein